MAYPDKSQMGREFYTRRLCVDGRLRAIPPQWKNRVAQRAGETRPARDSIALKMGVAVHSH